MDPDKKKSLERKFDRDLTEGEAAEIANTRVIHEDDESFYENNEGGLTGDGEADGGADAVSSLENLFRLGGGNARYRS